MIIQKATCLAVSQKTAENVKEYFRVKDVHVVGNGIDDQFFNNDIQLAKEYDAVFVGRIVPDKGIFELLEAWHRIVTKMPSAKLLLIGGFDNSVKESVFEVLERFQLEDNVTFTGFVTDEELVRLLKLSRIFVLPSYNEGFGLAIAEAMASGLPCIISDIPALKEIYLSAVLYVEPKNVDSLVNAIFFLLSNPLECEEFQAEGRKLAERFLWKKVIVTELDILKSTCSGQNTKSKP